MLYYIIKIQPDLKYHILLHRQLEMRGKAQRDSPVRVLLSLLANMMNDQTNCALRRLVNSSTDDGSNDCAAEIQKQRTLSVPTT